MSTPLPTRLVQAAESVIHEALHAAGKECFGGATPEARVAVAAVLRELAAAATHPVHRDEFVALADEIEAS